MVLRSAGPTLPQFPEILSLSLLVFFTWTTILPLTADSAVVCTQGLGCALKFSDT